MNLRFAPTKMASLPSQSPPAQRSQEPVMKCPECDFDNPKEMRFCGHCGAPLYSTCPNCNISVPTQFKFCGSCGVRLSSPGVAGDLAKIRKYIPSYLADKLQQSEGYIEGERKKVTAVFVDISGFTAMSELRDPEEVSAVVTPCHTMLGDIIDEYGGVVDKIVGDGLMAIFGIPAHEDDPERAILAAMEMQQGMAILSEELSNNMDLSLGISIGINTGIVIIGDVGTSLRLDYTVMGDVVNIASRLEATADKGEILLGHETYRKTAHCFDFEKLAPIRVRGKSQPLQVYKVLLRKEEPLQARGIEGLHSPFIGRNEEFSVCRRVIARLSTGKGGTLLITGEAGFGKSRLVAELQEYARGLDIAWLEGKCVSYARSIGYWVFVDALKNYFGIRDEAGTTEIERTLKSRGATSNIGESVVSIVGSLLSSKRESENAGGGLADSEKKLRIFAAIKDILAAESQTNPVILALDDLHWIDALSMELLIFLIKELSHDRVTFICIYRSMAGIPDDHFVQQLEKEYLHSASTTSGACTRVVLDPLSNVDSNLLLSSLLTAEDLPPKIKGTILEKAGGNPLYLEEVIRSIIDDRTIEKHNGRWLVARELEDIEVPDTVQEVIMARIDRLQVKPKFVLQCASAIGRSFEYDSLQFLVSGGTTPAAAQSARNDQVALLDDVPQIRNRRFDEHLKTLEEMGFISCEESNRCTFRFRHVLIQDVTYNAILKKRRRELHEIICHYLEEVHREHLDEFYELLAYHYSESNDVTSALSYLVRAGDKNRKSSAGSAESALQYFQKALDLLKNSSLTDDNYVTYEHRIYDGTGEAYMDLGDYEKALSSFETVFLVATKMRDLRIKAVALRQIGNNKTRMGNWEDARAAYEGSLAIVKDLGDLAQMGLVYNGIGYGLLDRGDMDEARDYFQEALKMGEQSSDLRLIGDASDGLGTIASIRHDFSEAIRYYQTSLRNYEKAEESHYEAQVYQNLGITHFRKNELEIADKYCEESLKISEKCGYNSLMAATYVNRAELFLERSELDKAKDFCLKTFRILRTLDDKWAVAEGYKLYGMIHERRKNLRSAMKAFNTSLAISEECDYVTNIAEVHREIGLMHKKQGMFMAALESFGKAREVLRDLRITEEVQVIDRYIDETKQDKKAASKINSPSSS